MPVLIHTRKGDERKIAPMIQRNKGKSRPEPSALLKAPEDCTLKELRPYASEYARRLRLGKSSRPKILRPCHKCGVDYGARDLRAHIPTCQKTIRG
jgi:hypothetical protein